MLQVSTNLIEFNLEAHEDRSFHKLQLQNVSPNMNIAFKIKSTNIERYFVSPTTDLLEPQNKATIDIVLHLKSTDKNLEKIDDKFAIFYMTVEEDLNKEDVESYLKKNSKAQQKIYIKIKINKKPDVDSQSQTQSNLIQEQQLNQDQQSGAMSDILKNSEISSYKINTNLIQNPDQEEQNEQDKQSDQNIQVERKQGMFTSGDNSYFKLQNEIYEKDQHIQKLKKDKKMLELNLQKIQQVIKDQRSFQDNKKTQKVQNFILFIIFFIGLVIGSFFTSH